jgi:hypothetical protein
MTTSLGNRYGRAASLASMDDAVLYFGGLHCDLTDRAGPWQLGLGRFAHGRRLIKAGAARSITDVPLMPKTSPSRGTVFDN